MHEFTMHLLLHAQIWLNGLFIKFVLHAVHSKYCEADLGTKRHHS